MNFQDNYFDALIRESDMLYSRKGHGYIDDSLKDERIIPHLEKILLREKVNLDFIQQIHDVSISRRSLVSISLLNDLKKIFENILSGKDKANARLETDTRLDKENNPFYSYAFLEGDRVTESEFNDILYPQIIALVHDYLGINSEIRRPMVSLIPFEDDSGDGYNDKLEIITLNSSHRVNVVTRGSHEYVHHLCNVLGMSSSNILSHECISRGIERKVAEAFCNSEKNVGFLYDSTLNTVKEIKDMYFWICDEFNVSPSKTILDLFKIEKYCKSEYIDHLIGPSYHSKGTSYALLSEERFGRENFYSHILKNK